MRCSSRPSATDARRRVAPPGRTPDLIGVTTAVPWSIPLKVSTLGTLSLAALLLSVAIGGCSSQAPPDGDTGSGPDGSGEDAGGLGADGTSSTTGGGGGGSGDLDGGSGGGSGGSAGDDDTAD